MFMWPVNSSCLLKLLRQIMQVFNLCHDVNSNWLLNFVICFKGFLAIRTDQLQQIFLFYYVHIFVEKNLELESNEFFIFFFLIINILQEKVLVFLRGPFKPFEHTMNFSAKCFNFFFNIHEKSRICETSKLSGVPSGFALGNSFRQRVIFDRISLVLS